MARLHLQESKQRNLVCHVVLKLCYGDNNSKVNVVCYTYEEELDIADLYYHLR
jgi:hypothetical protein